MFPCRSPRRGNPNDHTRTRRFLARQRGASVGRVVLLLILLVCGLLTVAFTGKVIVSRTDNNSNGNSDGGINGSSDASDEGNGNGDSTIAQPSQPARLGILLGGDILLDLEPGYILRTEGPTALMRGWAELRWLGEVDLGLANLECSLSTRGQALPGKLYTFRGDPEAAGAGLRWLGFDGLSLANNHVLDYGTDALADTLEALSRYGIASAGAGKDIEQALQPAIFEREGIRIAFLAFGGTEYMPAQYQDWWAAGTGDPGIAPLAPESRLLEAVRAARAGADLVIVSMHWGLEYSDVVPAQRELGKAVIDAGADIVFGHHPHVPQPVEIHSGRPIIYSLGNLAFHPFQEQARHMMVAEVQVERNASGKSSVVSVSLHPLYNNEGRTVRTPQYLAAGFLETMAGRCRALGTECTIEGQAIKVRLR